MTLRKALKELKPFFLIFWAEENSVTRVSKEKVLPSVKGAVHEVGSTVQVKDGKNVYSGQIAATGTEQEMKDSEEHFEAGRWNPFEVTIVVGEKRKANTLLKELKQKKRDDGAEKEAEGKNDDVQTAFLSEGKEVDDRAEGKEDDARTALVAEGKEVDDRAEGKEVDDRAGGRMLVAEGKRKWMIERRERRKWMIERREKEVDDRAEGKEGKILVAGGLPDTTQIAESLPTCSVQQPVPTPQVISSPICGGDDIYTYMYMPNEDNSGGSHDNEHASQFNEYDPLLLELQVMETKEQLEELQKQHTILQTQYNEMNIKVEESFGTIPHGLSPGVLQSTGLNCISFSQGPSNYPSASTSSGPTVLDLNTSTPARTSVPTAIAQLPRTQLHFTETESLQTPSVQALSIQAASPSIQAWSPSIQASSPTIQTPSSSPSAANQPEPAHHQTLPQPLPPVRQNTARCLDSCEIKQEMLRPVDEVLLLNAKYQVLSKASTLAVKLAKEAFFGDKCTVAGSREFPELPHKEMQELKGVMLRQFPQFWQTPVQFELTWKDCCESIGQARKRLRDKNKNVQ
ncbi:hypothetical protein EMCRGX_G019293 [Ephydatia muelleri]